jgi:hypothetical protein
MQIFITISALPDLKGETKFPTVLGLKAELHEPYM